MTMELVAMELSGIRRKSAPVEDKAAALQQKGLEMQQKADHAKTCLTMKYSATAREFAKNGFINMGLWNRSEQELKQAHQHAKEGVVKKLRTTVKPGVV